MRRALKAALLLAGLLPATVARAGEDALPKELRVCADPNNLPFSNAREEGFENRIAKLLAEKLAVPLKYEWYPQRRGFIRNTIAADLCDVVMGVPINYRGVLTTHSYYGSTYVFLSRQENAPVHSLDDKQLRHRRIGVHIVGDDGANTPGAHALARRGIVENVVGFSIYGDYGQPNPPARLAEAVAAGTIDVAIVWGPYAGYFAQRSPVPLRMEPVSPPFDPPGQTFIFGISIGVAKDKPALRRRLDALLDEHQAEIGEILNDYGVPRID
jgi:mxaJ protein